MAWDFTSFALSAVAADEAVSRERSPDGWTREIELTLAVTNPDLWKTQRGRLTEALRFLSGDIWSLEFVGHGTCLAKHRDGSPVELRIPENGFISQNVPLTPMRTGSLSTRTTHPYFLRLIQDTLDDVGLRINLNNPYETTTKGEMLVGCSDQGLLSGLAGLSTSCGRYSRTGFRHCGRCVPCQVRRETDAPFTRVGDDPLMPWQAYDCLAGLEEVRGIDRIELGKLVADNLRRAVQIEPELSPA